MYSQPNLGNAGPQNQIFESDEQTQLKLRQKFKCKKALHWFMVNKAVSTSIFDLHYNFSPFYFQNVFLPEEKNCPIGFLHQILGGEKFVFWNW